MVLKKKLSFVIPFDVAACQDSMLAGGKAARLAAMVGAAFPVPQGVVVTTDALRYFCKFNHIKLSSAAFLNSNQAVEALQQGQWPPELAEELSEAIDYLGTVSLAVRSSATAEDGFDFSMAGQFDTYLNVKPDQVREKILLCWAGLFGRAPSAYRCKSSGKSTWSMGVIIQIQIDACYAGVLFTLDPLRKSADHFVVEWVRGLGDKLVSGRMEPDRLYISRNHPVIDSDLPGNLAAGIYEACRWARSAEQLFNHPVDMEWGIDKEGFHLLQARPITGFTSDQTVAWTNVNLTENFPAPLVPLAWSVVDRFYTAYIHGILRHFGWGDGDFGRAAGVISNLTGIQGGRIYYNLNNWYEIMGFFPFSRWLIRLLNNYIGQKIPFNYTPKKVLRFTRSWWRALCRKIMFWPRLFKLLLTAERRMDAFEPRFYANRRSWRTPASDRLTADRLYSRLESMLTFVDRHWTAPGMADFLVMVFPGVLDALIVRWFATDAKTEVVQLFKGLDLTSTRSSDLIWQVAQAVGNNNILRILLEQGDYEKLEGSLSEELQSLLDEFMERYGGRCYHDCMIVAPTFYERHDLFWDLVKRYLNSSAADPRERYRVNRQDRLQYTQSILKRLAPVRRWIFRHFLKLSWQAVGLRERGRLLQSLLFGEIRLTALALGRQLAAKGTIDAAEDIFFLQLYEITKLLNGKFQFPELIGQMITSRKEAYKCCEQNEPPEFFFLDRGEYMRFDGHVKGPALQKKNRVLTGTGVAGGNAKGVARVILDPVQSRRMNPGDILITRAADPGWTPLFFMAGGLILERGGILSHGAIVAREFGIPAVVGIDRVTTLIADGQNVELDGTTGSVTLLDD